MRQAIEAIEHQARLCRMFNDPAYLPEVQDYLRWRRSEANEPDPDNFVDHFKTTVNGARAATATGTPFWWSPQMSQLLESVYMTMPIITLTKELLPSANGFFWFASPVMGAARMRTRVMMWSIMLDLTKDGPVPTIKEVQTRTPEELLHYAAGIQITMIPDHMDDAMTRDLRRVGRETWVIPHITVSWEFGQTQEVLTEDVELAKIERFPLMKEIQAIAAAFALLQQRVLTSPNATFATGADRKRIERAKPPHREAIRVVALRKAFNRASGADRQGGDPVDWSCRWLVGGHWRNQFYPSTGTHHPIYIFPHWKGPDDAPIKPPGQIVMSVHR